MVERGEVSESDDDPRRDLVTGGLFFEVFGEVGFGGIQGRGETCIVDARGCDGPRCVSTGELALHVAGQNVTGASDEFIDLVRAHIGGEDPEDVPFFDPTGVCFEVIEKGGVGLGVELTVLTGEHAQGFDLVGDFRSGGCRDMPQIGEVERRGALERVILDLLGFEATHRARLEIGTEAGVADETLLILLEAKIVAKEMAVDHATFALTEATGGADREDKRDDDERQEDAKNRAEVVLKILLNPSNHEGKTSDARLRASRGKGEFTTGRRDFTANREAEKRWSTTGNT